MLARPIELDEDYDDDSGGDDVRSSLPPVPPVFELKVEQTRVGYDAPGDDVQPITTPDITEKACPPRFTRFATRQEILDGEARGLLIPWTKLEDIIREDSEAIRLRYRMRQRQRARRKRQASLACIPRAEEEEELLTDSEGDECYLWQLPDYICPFSSSAMNTYSSGAVRPKIRRVQSAPACIYGGDGTDEDDDSSVYEILENALDDHERAHLKFTWNGDHLTWEEATSSGDTGDGATGISESMWGRTRWSLRDVSELPNTQVLDLNNKYLVACVEGDDSDGDQCGEMMRQSACMLLGKSDYNRYVIGRNKHRAAKVDASPPDQVARGGKRGPQTRPKSAHVINRRGLSGFARDMLVQLNVPEDVIRGCYVEKTKNQRWGPECLLTHLLLQYKKSVSDGTAVVPPPRPRKQKGTNGVPRVSEGTRPPGEMTEAAPVVAEEAEDSGSDAESGSDSTVNSSEARFAIELENSLMRGIAPLEPEDITSNHDMPDLSDMYSLMGDVGAQLDSVAEPPKSK